MTDGLFGSRFVPSAWLFVGATPPAVGIVGTALQFPTSNAPFSVELYLFAAFGFQWTLTVFFFLHKCRAATRRIPPP